MYKVTEKKRGQKEVVTVKSTAGKKAAKPGSWWKAKTKEELNNQVIATATWLKDNQQYRYRQAGMYSRLYASFPLYGWAGTTMNKMSTSQALPLDRPTRNVVQPCVDTLVSRITQSKPRPMFLTDDGDYKERKLAKQLNNFVQGEFYQLRIPKLMEQIFKDSLVLGTGVLKIFKSDNKVRAERRLLTELLVDPNDGEYGLPRQMYELQLIDRSVLAEMFPEVRAKIERAEQAYPDNSNESSQTITDQVMVVEAWRLPSSENANDGKHVISCSAGLLLEEDWNKDRFPFVFMHYSTRTKGFWGQGLAEQLMGTQVEINKLLMTITQSLNLVGVPKVLLEDGSRIVKAHLNNQIGTTITYRGVKPEWITPQSIQPEMYAQLEKLVQSAYEQSGVSALAASSQKPAGLNSGEAIRSYDDLQTDRFASVSKGFNFAHEEVAYLCFDYACDIAKETGSYQTIYPNKNGAKQIDLPEIDEAKKNQFIIQCFDVSALPKDPAGRLQKITEMIQAGMLDIREGRRLLDFPDLDQVEKLANASEERILQILDAIVEDGEYTPPDPFMELQLALTLSVQYYNLYVAAKLEEEKAQMIRDFNSQIKALLMEAAQPMPAPQVPGQEAQPIGVPQPRPVSDLLPQVAS